MSDDPILAALARLEAGQTKLCVDLMARLDGLQISVDAIRDDLTVLGGANDGIRRAAESTRDELRDLSRNVADMQRVVLKHGTRLDQLERRTP
jgi:hypothetical protein